MQRRYNFALATIVPLGLMALMADVDAQAQIAFVSDRDGNLNIYVMDADGRNTQNLTNSSFPDEFHPAWFPADYAVESTGKQFTMWGWLKQAAQ